MLALRQLQNLRQIPLHKSLPSHTQLRGGELTTPPEVEDWHCMYHVLKPFSRMGATLHILLRPAA